MSANNEPLPKLTVYEQENIRDDTEADMQMARQIAGLSFYSMTFMEPDRDGLTDYVDILSYVKADVDHYESLFNQCPGGDACNHDDKGFKFWDYICAGQYRLVERKAANVAFRLTVPKESDLELATNGSVFFTNATADLSISTPTRKLLPVYRINGASGEVNVFQRSIDIDSVDSLMDLEGLL